MKTDLDMLLSAILRDPEEDLPRLAYADCLEEQAGVVECRRCGEYRRKGNKRGVYDVHAGRRGRWVTCPACNGKGVVPNHYAERAEFIRVQCELAKPDMVDLLRGHGCRRPYCYPCALRRREQKLMGRNDWRPECLRWVRSTVEPARLGDGVAYGLFRRGFIEVVECDWPAWCEHGDAVLRLQPVRAVRLTDEPLFPRWWRHMQDEHLCEVAGKEIDVGPELLSDRDGIRKALPLRWHGPAPEPVRFVLPGVGLEVTMTVTDQDAYDRLAREGQIQYRPISGEGA